jgi:hypothetical protein
MCQEAAADEGDVEAAGNTLLCLRVSLILGTLEEA